MTREEAIERIKSRYDKWALDDKDLEAIQCTFPELTESEDERTKRELIDTIKRLSHERLHISEGLRDKYLAWIEKQKKLNIELIQRSWYMEGYHDREFGMEPKWTIKAEKGGPRYYENPNYGKPLEQKEQKPAENIAQLTVQGKGVYKICPHCKERMVRDDSKVYISMPPQYGYNCPKCGAIEFDTVMYDNPEMEEQKPAEWSEEDKKNLELVTDCIYEFYPDPVMKYKLKDWLKSLRPQPKQEWSEDIIRKAVEEVGLTQHQIDWLKFNVFPPRQEWDEVKLEFRGEDIKVKCPFFRDDKGRGYSTTEQDEDVAWYALRAWCEKKGVSLYDLYPREEWSEEDEKIRRNLMSLLATMRGDRITEETYQKYYPWLKSLRPQRGWKPSEEQKEALYTAIVKACSYEYGYHLGTLYQDLEKLM